jgi:hypothetical protein
MCENRPSLSGIGRAVVGMMSNTRGAEISNIIFPGPSYSLFLPHCNPVEMDISKQASIAAKCRAELRKCYGNDRRQSQVPSANHVFATWDCAGRIRGQSGIWGSKQSLAFPPTAYRMSGSFRMMVLRPPSNSISRNGPPQWAFGLFSMRNVSNATSEA